LAWGGELRWGLALEGDGVYAKGDESSADPARQLGDGRDSSTGGDQDICIHKHPGQCSSCLASLPRCSASSRSMSSQSS